MTLAAATSTDAVVQVVALLVGLVQTVALAVIADRSRRVRRETKTKSAQEKRQG